MHQNFHEIMVFVLADVELVAGFSDGVGFDDVGRMVKAARAAGPAIKDAKLALEEYANMTDEEAKGEEEWVKTNFDIPDDSVEAVIETALSVAIQLHELAKLVVKKG